MEKSMLEAVKNCLMRRPKILHNLILPCSIISFVQIKQHRNYVLIMDESFPAKHFKSYKVINRATSGSEPTLHVSKQVVGLEIPDKSTVDHSFHGFTDATCQSNRAIISRIRGILTRLWNRNQRKVTG